MPILGVGSLSTRLSIKSHKTSNHCWCLEQQIGVQILEGDFNLRFPQLNSDTLKNNDLNLGPLYVNPISYLLKLAF